MPTLNILKFCQLYFNKAKNIVRAHSKFSTVGKGFWSILFISYPPKGWLAHGGNSVNGYWMKK